jgi:hypothetical protein
MINWEETKSIMWYSAARVSALPIVDENGVFQDVYARR